MNRNGPIDGAQLLKSIDELASPVHALAMVLEERRTEIMAEVRARAQETLFCTICQARITGLADAIRAGWSCIIDDEGNELGNFAGHCGPCTERIEDEESVPAGAIPTEPSSKPKTRGTLFDISPEQR